MALRGHFLHWHAMFEQLSVVNLLQQLRQVESAEFLFGDYTSKMALKTSATAFVNSLIFERGNTERPPRRPWGCTPA